MNILFVGFLYDKNIESELIENSKAGLQGAANTFQWGLVEGLEKCLHKHIDLCTTLPVGTYPRHYNKLFIRRRKWDFRKDSSTFEIGYINITFLKQFIRFKESIKIMESWIQDKDGEKIIILYSLYTPFLKALKQMKNKHNAKIHVCLIVPDLPLHYGIQSPLASFHGILERIDGRQKINHLDWVDSFVILTQHMKGPLKIGQRPYIVIEGIVSSNPYYVQDFNYGDKKVILYAGTLQYKFGIDKLLRAFELLSYPNYELWICGSGEAEKEIINRCKSDSRIKFMGYVSKMEIYELQQNSNVLINPRTNDEEFTKYSFPSKTMEYMLSGKPVLMYKLDGVPDEYDQYLYYIKGSEPQDMADRIMEICEKPRSELDDFGQKARNFVLDNKSNEVQAKKIIDMANKAINNNNSYYMKYKN